MPYHIIYKKRFAEVRFSSASSYWTQFFFIFHFYYSMHLRIYYYKRDILFTNQPLHIFMYIHYIFQHTTANRPNSLYHHYGYFHFSWTFTNIYNLPIHTYNTCMYIIRVINHKSRFWQLQSIEFSLCIYIMLWYTINREWEDVGKMDKCFVIL